MGGLLNDLRDIQVLADLRRDQSDGGVPDIAVVVV